VALAAQVESALSLLLAEAAGRDLAGRLGAPTTQAWLRDRFRLTPHEAAASVRKAQTLHGDGGRAGQRADHLAGALSEGTVLPSQAQAIVDVLESAPASASTSTRRAAEDRLVEDAAVVDAKGLRRLGHRIWEVVDPDSADASEAARLEAAERRAHDRRRLGFLPLGDGMTLVTGRLPDADAAPWCAPRSTRWPLPCPIRQPVPIRGPVANVRRTRWWSSPAGPWPAGTCPTTAASNRGW